MPGVLILKVLMTAPETADNPLLAPWDTPEAAPPFAQIRPEHFAPAYAQAFAAHNAEIAAIAGRSGPPDFDNTIVALEQSGRALERIEHVFHLLAGADSNDALLEIEREMSPRGRGIGTRSRPMPDCSGASTR